MHWKALRRFMNASLLIFLHKKQLLFGISSKQERKIIKLYEYLMVNITLSVILPEAGILIC